MRFFSTSALPLQHKYVLWSQKHRKWQLARCATNQRHKNNSLRRANVSDQTASTERRLSESSRWTFEGNKAKYPISPHSRTQTQTQTHKFCWCSVLMSSFRLPINRSIWKLRNVVKKNVTKKQTLLNISDYLMCWWSRNLGSRFIMQQIDLLHQNSVPVIPACDCSGEERTSRPPSCSCSHPLRSSLTPFCSASLHAQARFHTIPQRTAHCP